MELPTPASDIRAAAEDGETGKAVEDRIFSRDFLLERPLLAAITQDSAPCC